MNSPAPPRLVLASSSPRRIQLLREKGIEFDTIIPRVEEVQNHSWDPRVLVAHNARIKAEAVIPPPGHALILGADTLVVFEGRILGKPSDWDDAVRMIEMLNGQTHEVLTGVHVLQRPSGLSEFFVESSRICFHTRPSLELENYLRKINPLDKAGAYAAQDDDGWLIASIEGSRSNVVGLPMEKLLKILACHGIGARPTGDTSASHGA